MQLKNFYLLLLLIFLWTGFFGIFKYFIWGIYKGPLDMTLEQVAGYLALGGFFAYFLGGLFYQLLKERLSLLLIGILSGIILVVGPFIGTNLPITASVCILIGFLYGYWGVLKNIIISEEIEYTKKGDTFINGFANIAFFVSIILGSIAGGLIAEKLGSSGFFMIALYTCIAGVIGFGLRQNGTLSLGNIQKYWKSYVSTYIPNFIFVIRSNFVVMLISALFLVIATILSQKAIAFSVEHLGKTSAEASTLLLYSAVGTIIGNFTTMKIGQSRWKFASIFSLIFAGLIFAFPYLMTNFIMAAILAGFAGFFFGTNYNLVESYFLFKIGKQGKREYGAASYGILSSFCLFFFMFLTYYLELILGFNGIFIFWGIVVLIFSTIFYTHGENL